jgi:protein ImuB
LAVRGERPVYQGVLEVVSGPHRIEGAWWDGGATARRDYYLMASEHAGLLWVYRQRGDRDEGDVHRPPSPWFLHGIFG